MLETYFLPMAAIVEMNPPAPSGIVIALEFIAALFAFRCENPAEIPSATPAATKLRARFIVDFPGIHFPFPPSYGP